MVSVIAMTYDNYDRCPPGPSLKRPAVGAACDAYVISPSTIVLTNAAGVVVDATNSPPIPNYGLQISDVSFGRYLNPLHAQGVSPLQWGYLAAITPGTANSPGFTGVTAGPVITMKDADSGAVVPPGVYSRTEHRALTLELTGASGASLYYTTNGAVPTAWSALYDPANKPQFDRTVVVRAVATAEGKMQAAPTTQSFLFKENVLGAAPGDPPLLRPDLPLTPQTRPLGYPEYSLGEALYGGAFTAGVAIPYAVSPLSASQHRAALMAQLSDLPSISLVMPVADFFDRDTAGIYACSWNTATEGIDPKGKGWERVTSMEWLHPGNVIPTDANPKHTDCAITMSGNSNLDWYRTEKHSLSLHFKRELGASKYRPNFSIFPQSTITNLTYDSLILRNPTYDSWGMLSGDAAASPLTATYAKDAFVRETLTQLNHLQLYYRWVHLYINGLYWGAYLLTEKADDDTCTRRFGGVGPYYVWKDAQGSPVGDSAGVPGYPTPQAMWTDLFTAADALYDQASAGQAASAEYTPLDNMMEVDGFIDYTILHGYLGNFDSLTNNGRVYRDVHALQKFCWLAYDVEVGADAGSLSRNCFNTWWSGGNRPAGRSEARLLWNLRSYPKFAQRFGDRAWNQFLMPAALQTLVADGIYTGDSSAGKVQQRFQAAADKFQAILLSESLRWGVGYAGQYAAAPRETTGTDYAVRSLIPGNTLDTGGFFAARRPIFLAQLQAKGLFSTVPLPILAPGADAGTWTLTAPNVAGVTTYYSLDSYDPDGPGLTIQGTELPAGTTLTLPSASQLMARCRTTPPVGAVDDTASWSNLISVSIP